MSNIIIKCVEDLSNKCIGQVSTITLFQNLLLCLIFQTPNNGFTYSIRKAPIFIAEQEIPEKTAGRVEERNDKLSANAQVF